MEGQRDSSAHSGGVLTPARASVWYFSAAIVCVFVQRNEEEIARVQRGSRRRRDEERGGKEDGGRVVKRVSGASKAPARRSLLPLHHVTWGRENFDPAGQGASNINNQPHWHDARRRASSQSGVSTATMKPPTWMEKTSGLESRRTGTGTGPSVVWGKRPEAPAGLQRAGSHNSYPKRSQAAPRSP